MQIQQPVLALGLMITAAVGIAGCTGGGTSPPSETRDSQPQPAAPTAAAPAASPTTAKVDPERKETKWIGSIPYDVFYDQPLTIAADATRLGGTVPTSLVANDSRPAAATAGAEMPAAGTPPTSASAGSTGDVNWQDVIPMNILVDEVKLLRARLSGNLQTLATFNQHAKTIALDGAMLSAMAALVTVHPETVSWKENAHFVRDLGYEVFMKSEGTGRGPFQATTEPFEKALKVLDGGTPPEMDSEPVVPFSDVVYGSEIMKRIEISFNTLKANINTEARMKEDPVGVERELRVLAALGTMMGDESYDSADEPKYQEFIKRFVGGGLDGVEALKTGNFAGFQSALNQVQTTCAECHQQFRGNTTGF